MGQALYRKYRSRRFDEVIGQDHIIETLKNAIKKNRISHAYLFTGPRGVGKTSVARILAHEVNQLSYDDDSTHLDIIEIDAASNRRIDEIRDLRDRVNITPTSVKYKVYIIDEVHMLTKEAFNALLKTLEEPPAHCIFILATTEGSKVPDTIVSRTQRYNFSQIGSGDTAKHLALIAKNENIEIETEALDLLARHGEGSFRDSIGLLDQLSGFGGKITAEVVQSYLGLPPSAFLKSLVEAIFRGSSRDAVVQIENLWAQGANPALVAKHLSQIMRSKLLESEPKDWLTTTLRQLIEVPSSPSPREYLEICIIEATIKNSLEIPVGKRLPTTTKFVKASSSPIGGRVLKQEISSTSINASGSALFDISIWPEVIDKSKDKAASLYTALRLAKPHFSEDKLILSFEFPLHKKKVAQAKNLVVLSGLIEEMTGVKVKIECNTDKDMFGKSNPASIDKVNSNSPQIELSPVEAINNIFGPTEVLES